MREQPKKCPWRQGLRVRLSGQALMTLLLVLLPSAGFGKYGIGLDPEDARNYYKRGCDLSEKKEYDKAIADFSEAIRIDPNYARAYLARGIIWEVKKEYDKAIADFSEAIRINPKDSVAYVVRGCDLSEKKEYDKAIADFSEAIRIDPQDSVAYNNRAWLWATCPDAKYRDGKKAVDSATKACEITEWKEANLLDTLAAAYAEAGDFDSAVKWQTNANALNLDAQAKTKGEARLKLYQEKKPYREKGP
jgi:tetratricopeptide (TPR) repeat protein